MSTQTENGESRSTLATGSLSDVYETLVDEYQKALDELDEEEAKSLLLPLLMKRAVDGGSGRVWDASEHRKWEQRVQLLTGAHGLHAFKKANEKAQPRPESGR